MATIRFPMLVVHVHVHVKPGCVEAFAAASLANARHSVREPGVARFDVVQQADDPTRFVLVEAYRSAAAPAAICTSSGSTCPSEIRRTRSPMSSSRRV